VLFDTGGDIRFACQQRRDAELVAQQRADLVQRDDIGRIGNRQREFVIVAIERHRQHMVAARGFFRDQRNRRGINQRVGKIDTDLAQTFRQRIAHRRLGNEAQ
jgi:hypothetical protein